MQDENKTRDQVINELAVMRQRVAELERFSQDLDAFTYTIVHDLKRQLSLILGFANLLEEEYTTVSREELLKRLRVVIQAGHKMDSIIDELMLLVHVRDMESLKMIPLDMGNIVTEALNRLAHVIKRQQVEIIVPERWPKAFGYTPWVEEVWYTYISETLRHDDRSLRIMVGATEQADENTRFWVHVDSRDLTSEQQARISQMCDSFRPGLVQCIMDKLGGQLGVTREKGQSNGFYFTLPSGE